MHQEYLMNINEYNEPEIRKDKDAVYMWLIRLLLMNPGTIESHPEMGVGLVKNWRYSYMENISELKTAIEKQIEVYLAQFQGVTVEVTESASIEKQVDISIKIENIIYTFNTNSDGTLNLDNL